MRESTSRLTFQEDVCRLPILRISGIAWLRRYRAVRRPGEPSSFTSLFSGPAIRPASIFWRTDPHHIILADGRRIPIRDDALAVLRLLEAPQIKAQEVFTLGRRLFEVGGLEPLEAIMDTVVSQLGRETAAELVIIWTAVIEGEELAA
jgi:hypothetical protein